MEDFKIKVIDEAESKEAQELLFKLGFAWPHGQSYMELGRHYNFITAHESERRLTMDRGRYAEKEVTLNDLRNMVAQQSDQPDAGASPNDIARTAEVHREHNLANELNDLCAEFGCLPGVDRMDWLRERLRGTKKPRVTETMYHYAALVHTARSTVHYDGVITMPERITSIEDYHKARAEIAKDGNATPDQVNVLSLSIIN